MNLERLVVWKSILEEAKNTHTLTLDEWFDEETGAMDPLSIACGYRAFQLMGLRYDSEYRTPRFFDLAGYDACSAFFRLTKPQVRYIIDPLSYKFDVISFEDVIDHLGHVINKIAEQTEKKETE